MNPAVARGYEMDDPDIGLMLRVKDGDEEAFRLLFRKHGPRVRQFVRRQVGDGPVADELVQDVFTQLFEARRRYRPKPRRISRSARSRQQTLAVIPT